MRYCTRCILPDTRPHLRLDDEGVCNACRNFESRQRIDWSWREKLFQDVVNSAKKRTTGYDCVIPVSGGKDSTWQVLTCLDYGLKPLAVTWRPPGRTDLGQKNLDNLISLGVDHIDYSINPEVEKKFTRKTFEKLGSTAIPMHLALFNIPLNIAEKFNIPLVVWGENSAFEYGDAAEEHRGFELNQEWLKSYGVTHGTTAHDWISEELTSSDLRAYFPPDDSSFVAKKIRAIFLGYYFPWDPENSLKVARAKGFKERIEGPRVGIYDYADIDDVFISVHHYLKWHKFGFTRDFDNLSLEIRFGRLTRTQSIDMLKEKGLVIPEKDLEALCHFLELDLQEFNSIAGSFRNKDIWRLEKDRWMIKDFLIPNWSWS